MTLKGKKTSRRVMRSFKMSEISAVDVPAQEGALAAIIKSAGGLAGLKSIPIVKYCDEPGHAAGVARMTSDNKGHSHLVPYADGMSGETSYGKMTGEDYGHTHPWVRDESGNILIGASAGHTHTIEGAEKRAPDPTPTATEKNAMDPKDKQIAELTATATRLEGELSKSHKWGQLNDAERAYAKSLGNDTERELFVAKTATERDIIVKAYTEVVYEDLDGNKYTKADDKRLVDNAKRSDAAMKRAHEAEAKERAVTMTKRAEAELSNLPGTAEDKAWLLDVVSKAAEADLAAAKLAKADDAAIKSLGERAKRVGEILKAGNTAMSGVYVPSSTDVVEQTIVTKNADGSETTETVSVAVPTHGDASVGIAKNADGQAFERLVRAHMAKTKCDEADAYAAVMKSHPDLYKRAYGSYGPQA